MPRMANLPTIDSHCRTPSILPKGDEHNRCEAIRLEVRVASRDGLGG